MRRINNGSVDYGNNKLPDAPLPAKEAFSAVTADTH
jgi:hypothetical protein